VSTTLDGAHNRTIRWVAWSPNGQYLASAGFDGVIAIWEKIKGEFECVATLEGHENEVKCIAWSASGRLLASCSRDKSVWIWEAEEDKATADEEKEFQCLSVLHGHSQDVKHVRWHPTEDLLVSASYDDTLKVWTEQEDDWYCGDTLTSHSSTVWCVDFNPAGDKLVTCSDDKTVVVWGLVDHADPSIKRKVWAPLTTLSGRHERCVYCVNWSSKNVFASCGADDCIFVFAEETSDDGEITYVCTANKSNAHAQDVNCVAWHPSGNQLASCGDDMLVKVWEYKALDQSESKMSDE